MKKRIKDKLKRNRKKLSPQEIEQNEFKIMQQNIINAQKLRDMVANKLKETDDPILAEHLAKLDEAIVFERLNYRTRIIDSLSREAKTLAEGSHRAADECTDEELLRLGEKAKPFIDLETLVELRANLAAPDGESADEKLEQVIGSLDTIIREVGEKLKGKLANARKRREEKAEAERRYDETQQLYKTVFPKHIDLRAMLNQSYEKIPPTQLTADGTEYEMSDDYKDSVEKWEAAVDLRDLLLRQIEKMKAEKREGKKGFKELVENAKDIDEWIQDAAIKLKEEKESYQELRRSQEKAEVVITDYENSLQDAIAQNPHILLGGSKTKGQ
jgi:hypothetical protein